MQGQIEVPDDELDALARRLGWADLVLDPQGPSPFPTLPNPIPQDQYVTNKAQEYLNNEAIAAAANAQAEAARAQAISDKTAVFAAIVPTVTTSSKIVALPPQRQPLL